jgi:pantoate--beta-alanine ligase
VISVRIVGAGRAGSSLTAALEAAGWEVDLVGRDADLANAGVGVDLVVIATPDAAVADVARRIDPQEGTVVAHLAGALGLAVLEPHARRAALHPLVAMPDTDVGARRLREGAWFAVAGDPLARQVVDALGGRWFAVADADRVRYHAAAVIASNHLVALLGQVERVAAGVGVPLEAYLDLVRLTVDNVAELGPAAALTGPAARGDWETIRAHLDALEPSEREAYDALARAARRLVAGHAGGMEVHEGIEPFRRALDRARREGATVGLVPTMGYLHEGHLALMKRSVADGDVTVVTIFVNPLQFGAGEDLESYPRDLPGDLAGCESAGVKHVLVPAVEEMYPEPAATSVRVDELASTLEGAARPTHFAGVATVVAKLFNIAGPCRAYFGEKDYQQLAVIRRMVADLSFPVEVIGCPTVREPDGLAMSSRNAYLAPAEREAAPVLHRALQAGAASILAGERDADRVRDLMAGVIAAEPLARLDYAEVVDPHTLEPLTTLAPGSDARLLVAARLGIPRLLDNLGLRVPG